MIVLRELTGTSRKTLASLFKDACQNYYSPAGHADRWRAAWTLLLADQRALVPEPVATVREFFPNDNLWLWAQWFDRRVTAWSSAHGADDNLWLQLIEAQSQPVNRDNVDMYAVAGNCVRYVGDGSGVEVRNGRVAWRHVSPGTPHLAGSTYHIGGMLRELRVHDLRGGGTLSVDRSRKLAADVVFKVPT